MNIAECDPGREYLIARLPQQERPRERLLNKGSEYLSDIELLAIVLRSGPAGMSTLDLARSLLQRFNGDLAELAAAPPVELAQVKGIGPAKAAELKATFALAARLSEHIRRERPRISSPESAADFFREKLRGRTQEELHALLLDAKNRVIRDVTVSVGLLDRSPAHAREVFREAIRHSCAKVLLVHNHPSGDPTPSKLDITCTKHLAAAGKTVGIEVIDHIIIGFRTAARPKDFVSMREMGLM
jgi:DNA repair protein RadC